METAASKIDMDKLRVAVRKVLAYKPPPKPDTSTQTAEKRRSPKCNPPAKATPGKT